MSPTVQFREALRPLKPWKPLWSTGCALVLMGCGPLGESGQMPGPGADEGGTDEGGHPSLIALNLERDVDILFVVDNSASMAGAQATLAKGAEALIGVLEAPGAEVNYRIGFTTTDNGNALCPTTGINDTTPESGVMQATSCTTRAETFEWPHSGPKVEAFDEACAAQCPVEVGDALSIAGSPTATDAELRPRPWLERAGGETNLRLQGEPLADMATAFRCMSPQGVDGCGFESQLESQYKAIARANVSDQDQYGFLRTQASLAIVHVTDAADCSVNLNVDELVFDTELQDSPFWTDVVPTSGICWNAGTRCEGSGTPYESCVTQSYNYLGEEVSEVYDSSHSDEESQVLLPVGRYIEQLEEIRETKQIYGQTATDPVVAVIAGVPEGYADGAADLVYQEDASTESAFGIGFGCEWSGNPGGEGAVPPVRLRAFAEAFAPVGGLGDAAWEANLFSVCADDYSPALQAVAEAAVAQLGAGCFPACVQDVDPELQGLQVECTLTQEMLGVDGVPVASEIPACEDAPIPNDVGACYEVRVDGELDSSCAAEGFNVGFLLRRDFYAPVPALGGIITECRLSERPREDCPGMY